MRLTVRSYIGLLMCFALIVKLMLAGAEPLPLASHAITQALIFQSNNQKLNKDGEHNNYFSSTDTKLVTGSHTAKARLYLSGCLTSVSGVALSYIDYSLPAPHEKARHFTPLFHFLLYPKHWFW